MTEDQKKAKQDLITALNLASAQIKEFWEEIQPTFAKISEDVKKFVVTVDKKENDE